ncbi:PfkB family carbohydrate kinase [Okibacterium endophyticum]
MTRKTPSAPPSGGTARGVVIFSPSPILTVTIEDQADAADIHVHAGGQGVWQARMLRALGIDVTMCCALSGETGRIVEHLLDDEGFRVLAVRRQARGAAYVHDRRRGDRIAIAESEGTPLSRHEIDELYGLTLRAALNCGTAILSGPMGSEVVPADIYRRLAADLRASDCTVIADLSGERLTAAISGGIDVLKVSDTELKSDGFVTDTDVGQLVRAMHGLRERGVGHVIVTRAAEAALLLADGRVNEVHLPTMQPVDTSGAGDSLTAGVAATLAAGGSIEEAVALGAAAGALNVTRHGLGTGEGETVYELRGRVRLYPVEDGERTTTISPDELARRVKER